jgi:hypothetical protein
LHHSIFRYCTPSLSSTQIFISMMNSGNGCVQHAGCPNHYLQCQPFYLLGLYGLYRTKLNCNFTSLLQLKMRTVVTFWNSSCCFWEWVINSGCRFLHDGFFWVLSRFSCTHLHLFSGDDDVSGE